LVGAAGVFVATTDAAEFLLHVIHMHAAHKDTNTLQIAIAATGETDILEDAILIDIHVYQLATGAKCLVSDVFVGHYSSGFMLV
jgi:hypothetical protein